MGKSVFCDLCGREIPKQGHYVVRIEVFADPAMPKVTAEEIERMDFAKVMKELLAQMHGMSGEELQNQVYRKFEYRVCGACQRRVLANPLGRPRERREGRN